MLLVSTGSGVLLHLQRKASNKHVAIIYHLNRFGSIWIHLAYVHGLATFLLGAMLGHPYRLDGTLVPTAEAAANANQDSALES